MDCIFCKVVKREIPANIVYEDEYVVAFDDITPKAPIHKLVIPKKHIPTLNDLQEPDASLISRMTVVARDLAREAGIAESGFRIIMNCNEGGGQTVFHIHLHLLGGRNMTWPPG